MTSQPITPVISFNTINGAFDSEDNLLVPAIVKSLEDGTSLLTFVFSVDGEIPPEGVIVTLNSNIALRDYFANLGVEPFAPGGEFLGAVYNDKGEATGFKFKLTQANALINLAVKDNGKGTEKATFTLEKGADYSVDTGAGSSEVTFYETIDKVPVPSVTPKVGFSVNNNTLSEAMGNSTTLTFTLSEPPPPGGLLVYVKSPTQTGGEGDAAGRDLAEFDIYNAEIVGGAFPAPNFAANGFYFKITEQTASITLSAFADGEVEGIEEFSFELQETPGYTIDSQAAGVTLKVVDDATSLIQVSLTASPQVLVESEGTVSEHKFTLSATPPKEGITISVKAPNLSEFNLDGIVVEGGKIVAVRNGGFDFNITAKDATIKLPVKADGKSELVEQALFSLQPGTEYQIDRTTNSGKFTIVDVPEFAPPLSEVSEPNDTIDKAFDTKLSSAYPKFSINSTLDFEFDNSYLTDKGLIYVDNSEDVDFYKVELKAGDTIKIDTDSNQFEPGRKVDTWLRVFDADGKELASNDDGTAPDEVFDAGFNSYIEFTAPGDGTYYIGASLYNNDKYDPSKPASGNGNSSTDPDEYGTGKYTLNVSLNDPDAFTAKATEIPAGNSEGPTIFLQTVTGTYGSDFDTLGFNILSPGLVETAPEDAGTALNLVLVASGEVPKDGIDIFVSSDIVLTNYFGGVGEEDYTVPYGGNLNSKPFSRGGEFLNAVYNEAGEAIGFKFKLKESFATITLNPTNREEAETNGAEKATFTLVESISYQVSEAASSSTVTFYDTVDQVPAPKVTPEVSLEFSKTELIESQETATTIKISLSEPPPAEGVQVYISGNAQDALNEFSIFKAEFTGGVPVADGAVSGFYFQVLSQTATITLPVFNSVDIVEGIEEFNFEVKPGAGYTVNPAKSSVAVTIKDTPDSQILVSLSTESTALIETEETVGTLKFSLSATPPKEGVIVTVKTNNLEEDLDPGSIKLEGAELVDISQADKTFTLKITAKEATLSAAIAQDDLAESVETITYEIVPGSGYQVNPEANTTSFTLVDSPELAPTSTEESNDTLATAIATGLAANNTKVTFDGEIAEYSVGEDDSAIQVDGTEDVDLYKVELKAGDKFSINVDAAKIDSKLLYSQLRVFDAEGKEVAKTDFDDFQAAPDEVFSSFNDPYLEFTADKAGTYYVGVSQIGNDYYDPNVVGSGSGWVFPDSGIESGKYSVTFNLNPASVAEPTPTNPYGDAGDNTLIGTVNEDQLFGNGGNDKLYGKAGNDTLYAAFGNDLLDGGDGNDTLYGNGGSDTLLGGAGDDIIYSGSGDDLINGGVGNDIIYINGGKDTIVLGKGAGVDTLYNFQTELGQRVSLGSGLSYNQLTLTQTGLDTTIKAGDETLAVFKYVQASSLNSSVFTTV
ncbi:MAG: peptidase [Methylacidiphilales bacterium]|nr:peptidase [Candidatus Methylacidiphilales bacterium]